VHEIHGRHDIYLVAPVYTYTHANDIFSGFKQSMTLLAASSVDRI